MSFVTLGLGAGATVARLVLLGLAPGDAEPPLVVLPTPAARVSMVEPVARASVGLAVVARVEGELAVRVRT